MIVDTFTLAYQADTSKAAKDIDALDKKVEKSNLSAEQKGKKMMDQLTKSLTEGKAKINAAMEATNKELESSMDKSGESFAKKIQQKFTSMFSTAGSMAGKFSSVPGALIGGMGGMGMTGGLMGGAAGAALGAASLPLAIAAAAAAGVKKGIEEGFKQSEKWAERAATFRKEAWEAGLSGNQLNRAEIQGQRLGIGRDDVKGAFGNLKTMMLEANQRNWQDAYNSQGGRAFRAYGIKSKGMDIESVFEQVIQKIRSSTSKRGMNYGIAVAEKLGVSFDAANKIINASEKEIREMNKGLAMATAEAQRSTRESKKLADARAAGAKEDEKHSLIMSNQVTPSITGLQNSWTELKQRMEPVTELIGQMAAAIIDLGKSIVDFLNKSVDNFKARQNIQEGAQKQEDFISKAMNQLVSEGKIKAPEVNNASGYNNAEIAARARGAGNYTMEDFHKLSKEDQARVSQQASRIMHPEDKAAQEKSRMSWVDEMKGKYLSGAKNEEQRAALEKIAKDAMARGDSSEKAQSAMQKAMEKLVDKSEKGLSVMGGIKKAADDTANNTAPLSMSIEQALALWAGEVGKAGGLKAGPANIKDYPEKDRKWIAEQYRGQTMQEWTDEQRHAQRINKETGKPIEQIIYEGRREKQERDYERYRAKDISERTGKPVHQVIKEERKAGRPAKGEAFFMPQPNAKTSDVLSEKQRQKTATEDKALPFDFDTHIRQQYKKAEKQAMAMTNISAKTEEMRAGGGANQKNEINITNNNQIDAKGLTAEQLNNALDERDARNIQMRINRASDGRRA